MLIDNSATNVKKQNALKFLVHFIGDIHQPLHVGNGKDYGANNVKVKWFNEPTNLHKIWDEKLIDYQNLSYTEYARFLLIDADNSRRKSRETIGRNATSMRVIILVMNILT